MPRSSNSGNFRPNKVTFHTFTLDLFFSNPAQHTVQWVLHTFHETFHEFSLCPLAFFILSFLRSVKSYSSPEKVRKLLLFGGCRWPRAATNHIVATSLGSSRLPGGAAVWWLPGSDKDITPACRRPLGCRADRPAAGLDAAPALAAHVARCWCCCCCCFEWVRSLTASLTASVVIQWS